MKETICTIPINDVFGPKDGCPICRLRDMLEKNSIDYITGAAMMEPDVRVETNEKGFCGTHLNMMLSNGKRLQNALILETHLEKIIQDYFPEKVRGKASVKELTKIDKMEKSCFVCDRIEWGMVHMFETIFDSYEKDEEFKKLYNSQTHICLPHYKELMLISTSKRGIRSKIANEFNEDTQKLVRKYLVELQSDVSHFCSMFDYRNRGGDWKNSKDAIERSIEFLTTRKVEKGEE